MLGFEAITVGNLRWCVEVESEEALELAIEKGSILPARAWQAKTSPHDWRVNAAHIIAYEVYPIGLDFDPEGVSPSDESATKPHIDPDGPQGWARDGDVA